MMPDFFLSPVTTLWCCFLVLAVLLKRDVKKEREGRKEGRKGGRREGGRGEEYHPIDALPYVRGREYQTDS
jgi:hypothetical protein